MALRLYDYQCTECEHVHEFMRRDDDTGKPVCLECGGLMERIISAPTVLKPGGDEGQAYKAIQEINKKDRVKKERIYSR